MEPLLSYDFFKILEYCRYLGMAVSVTTNGTLIDDRIAEELSRKNVLYVAISLEGLTEQTNDVLRGKGNFKRTVDGIKILKNRFRSESNRLFLQICLTPINENEIENDIAYFLSGFDGMKVSFCRIHPFGNLNLRIVVLQ